jgi:hypothetical protein
MPKISYHPANLSPPRASATTYDGVTFQPGPNDIPQERWDAIKDAPAVRTALRLSALIVEPEPIAATPTPPPTPTAEPEPEPEAATVNLNTAPPAEIAALRYLGKSSAEKIIASRPHPDLDGVRDRAGLTISDDRWNEIKPLLTI